jgi:hypothetical protein
VKDMKTIKSRNSVATQMLECVHSGGGRLLVLSVAMAQAHFAGALGDMDVALPARMMVGIVFPPAGA